MTRSIGPADIVELMQVPGEPGLYILGCYERRVTLYSQQVRALNLIYALLAQKVIRKDSRIAVVGGGAAGMTAAAAACHIGCSVTLLESRQSLLPLLRGDTKRWLHPHLYDWPEEGSERLDAGLPLLDWQADLAPKVLEQIESGWKRLTSAASAIDVNLNASSVRISLDRKPPRPVSWNAPGHRREKFDAIIVAVGFGIERQLKGVGWPSYWRSDHLDELDLTREQDRSHRRHLISGCGDGGLVDLLRVRINGFRHDRILDDFGLTNISEAQRRRLLEIDREAEMGTAVGKEPDEVISNKYQQFVVPPHVDDAIAARLRTKTIATLNGEGEHPLRCDSSVLNRFLVSRLLYSPVLERVDGGIVPYRAGKIRAKRARDGVSSLVTFPGVVRPEVFDVVVVRHGAEPAIAEHFAEIHARHGKTMRDRARLDQTRTPIWPANFFGPEKRTPSPIRPSSAPVPIPTASYVATGILPDTSPDSADPFTANALLVSQMQWAMSLVALVRKNDRQNAWAAVLPYEGFDEIAEVIQSEVPNATVVRLDLASIGDGDECLRTLARNARMPVRNQKNPHQLAKALLRDPASSDRLVLLVSGWGAHAHGHGLTSLKDIAVQLASFRNVSSPSVVTIIESPTPPRHLIDGFPVGSILNLHPVFGNAEGWAASYESRFGLPAREAEEIIKTVGDHLGALRVALQMPAGSHRDRMMAVTRFQSEVGAHIWYAVGKCCADVLTTVAMNQELRPSECSRLLLDAKILLNRDGRIVPRIDSWATAWKAMR